MSYSKEVTIWCDADDCFEHFCNGMPTASEARKWAKDLGWTNDGSEDYCPEHS